MGQDSIKVDQQRNSCRISEAFLDQVGLELKRAERYRAFLSLTVLDLGFAKESMPDGECARLMDKLHEMTRRRVRVCDTISLADGCRLCLLLPETSRQGAEATVKRISEEVSAELSRYLDSNEEPTIPVELASYPDAAGAKTILQFLEEFEQESKN